jgi:flagellar operon protein
MSLPLHTPAIGSDAPAGANRRADAPRRQPAGPSRAFAEHLREQQGALALSKHATQRVERRQIDLSTQTRERLERGAALAAAKGARESLVLVDGTAFVVSVRNSTVITALAPAQAREQVFTNIDSAVIA